MKVIYFDTIAGISGDMALGSFISAGVSLEVLKEGISKLNLHGIEIEASHNQVSGITAVRVDVIITEKNNKHRHLSEINEIIDRSALDEEVKTNSKKIFKELAQAESAVHGIPVEKVHFHEVGALDSIVDIVGTAICINSLGIDAVFSSPVKLGNGGFIKSDHGMLPIPSPATVEILRNYPTVLTNISSELTTPTGAAIIKALSQGTLTSEKIKIHKVGYGKGSRELPGVPNVLRIIVGEINSEEERDECIQIEANIDNMNPELYPYVMERLFSAGAKDVFIVPVIMKKGRPGNLISILVSSTELDDVIKILFRETTTIGIRMHHVSRRKLEREEREVETEYGNMRMKVIKEGGIEWYIPEFEECKRVAIERGLSLKEVYNKIMKRFG